MAKLVSKVYGDAYVSAIETKPELSYYLEEIKSVKDVFVSNREIEKLLDSPKMEDEEKIDLIKGIFEGRISEESLGFLITVIQKKRQDEFIPIMDYIIDCIKELLGIGRAKIVTALPMDEERRRQLEERLLHTSHYNLLEVEYSTDESILGGIVIRIGDRVVDSSVRTRIEKMRKMLV